jgi:hypothetical protein
VKRRTKYETNGMSGESHFTLCVDDMSTDQPAGELCAYFYWDEAGGDKEPQLHLIARDRDDPDNGHNWNFILPLSQVRRLCDLAEAVHKFGLVQWQEIGGVREEATNAQ